MDVLQCRPNIGCQVYFPQAAFGMILHGGFLYALLSVKIAASGSLKRVTVKIFKIIKISYFMEASKIFDLDFFE
jgi:hypothetical protein